MGWDAIAVFVLSLAFFEGIAYLMWWRGDRKKSGMAGMPKLTLTETKGIDANPNREI